MEEGASFGYRIRRQRKARDLTQTELASQVGVSVAMIRRLEADERRPSKEVAARLAQVLAIPVEDQATFLKVARAELAADHLLPASPHPLSIALSVVRPPQHRQNLPAQATSLIGREHEVAAVASLLREEDVRLLALTGPGGTGKTRLALAVAAELQHEFADGVWFVELAPIREPEFVAPAIAARLDLRVSDGQPFAAALQAYLRPKQTLLLLDNFEQVIAAAPLLADLLKGAPRLKLLVTSRAVLHLNGEHEYPVFPLALPDLASLPTTEALARNAAVALFVQRAQAIRPDFRLTADNAQAVATICCRLDGLPLALELAAARVKLLPPQVLLARLNQRLRTLTGGPRDLPSRQQSLRTTIAWSWDLLTPAEQMLFRRLAVFAGGWTLEATEAVCNPEGDLAEDVLDVLATLVDKSLVDHHEALVGESRFGMLETLREFALECLTASTEENRVRKWHAAYYMTLAEAAEPSLHGREGTVCRRRLAQTLDNLRAALQWSLAGGDPMVGLRLAGALWEFWLKTDLTEGRAWLERALEASRSQAEGAAAARAKAIGRASDLAWRQGDLVQARTLAAESLALSQHLGDRGGSAFACMVLAHVEELEGNDVQAAVLFAESLALFRAVGDKLFSAWALFNSSEIAQRQGELVRASALAAESLPLFQEADEPTGEAFVLLLQSEVAREQGDTAGATALSEESVRLSRDRANAVGVASALLARGDAALAQSEVAKAARLYGESLALFQERGASWGIIMCFEQFARVAGAQGQAARAIRLWGAAEKRRERCGLPSLPTHQAELDRAVASVRAQLDEASFAAAWAEGQAMSLDQAISYALEETGSE